MTTTIIRVPEIVWPRENVTETLDSAVKGFENHTPTRNVVRDLVSALLDSRTFQVSSEWTGKTIPVIRSHAIMRYAQQDPFTGYSFKKPRGYPGDAHLLDMIYLKPDTHSPKGASQLGRELFECTVNFSAAAAVRWRRTLLAEQIDQIAGVVSGCRILSVACGHLREAELSNAVRESTLGEFIAIDQDELSLSTVTRLWGKAGVRAVKATVKDLLCNRMGLGRFHLIYAAGLYDYLQLSTAKMLTCRLFELLDSGGVLLIPNFLPTVLEVAYMEAFGDWWLTYRTLEEIAQFAQELPPSAIADLRLEADPSRCIGYLRIFKK